MHLFTEFLGRVLLIVNYKLTLLLAVVFVQCSRTTTQSLGRGDYGCPAGNVAYTTRFESADRTSTSKREVTSYPGVYRDLW